MTKRTESWAVLDVSTGRWAKACADCVDELRPVHLPAINAWGAWHKGQAVMLLPQADPDHLRRGDHCDLCLAQGRHRMWSGERWLGHPHPRAHAAEPTPQPEPAQPAALAI